MLLIKLTIKLPCLAGQNLAEQTEVGKRKMETIYGQKYDPVLECTAVGGLPFASLPEVKTPIALKIGDDIDVDAETGAIVYVRREGSVIWPAADPEPEPVKASRK